MEGHVISSSSRKYAVPKVTALFQLARHFKLQCVIIETVRRVSTMKNHMYILIAAQDTSKLSSSASRQPFWN